jgi:hypothetical protein
METNSREGVRVMTQREQYWQHTVNRLTRERDEALAREASLRKALEDFRVAADGDDVPLGIKSGLAWLQVQSILASTAAAARDTAELAENLGAMTGHPNCHACVLRFDSVVNGWSGDDCTRRPGCVRAAREAGRTFERSHACTHR